MVSSNCFSIQTCVASIEPLNLLFLIISFTVYLRCVGGEVGATSSLAPKIGPLGLVSYSKKYNFCSIIGYNNITYNLIYRSL